MLENELRYEYEKIFSDWILNISGEVRDGILKIIPDREVFFFNVKVNKGNVKKVFLESNVDLIRYDCFREFYDLEDVEFSKNINLKVIAKNAFSYCSKLRKIDIPDSVTKIEVGAFKGCCNLKKVKLPSLLVGLRLSSTAGINCAVFSECNNISDITFYSYTLPTIFYLDINKYNIKKNNFDN